MANLHATAVPGHAVRVICWLVDEDKSMEFETEREEALYTTLRQLLQTHVTSQALAYHETLAACMSVLGYVLYVLSDTPDDTGGLVEHTIAALHPRLHSRVAQEPRLYLPFPDYELRSSMSDPAQELGTALATYLATSGIEYRMSVLATWRAYLALVVDLLLLPLHAGVQTLEEVEAHIETLRYKLPAVMQMWGEEE